MNIDFVCVPRLSEADHGILSAYNTILDLCPNLDEQISWLVEYDANGLFGLAQFVSLSQFLQRFALR